MAQVNIDVLAPQKKLIDLDGAHNESLDNLITDDYVLDFIFDDILLIEFIDEVNDGAGDAVMRGGVYIPTNAIQRAWRKGRVILAGPESKYTKKDDIVVFPNNLGVGISNTEIGNHGMLRKGIFLNESRLFGICKKKKVNESKSRKSKTNTTK
tara:strand:+ start:1367 stop:1825 length:459 start_codon:yes stop_codon:yes gene_type:complete